MYDNPKPLSIKRREVEPMDLRERSIEIIKENQDASGAYIASPNFENYQYSWLRDGSFIAYAMDRVGEVDSADRFYRWVAQVIAAREEKVRDLIGRKQQGLPITPQEFLPTRYRLDGSDTNDNWANFQLDGYGTWLWGLAEHIKITGRKELLDRYQKGIALTVDYLLSFWTEPNYDCWEEYVDLVHPSTLACIAGGLERINQYLERADIGATVKAIKSYIKDHFVHNGHIVKANGFTGVDASLLWMAVPFRLFPLDDPVLKATVGRIERDLFKKQQGVHRYLQDTYYGGGAWILLTAWLGWYYLLERRVQEAIRIKEWIEAQANDRGELPEQVPINLNQESTYQNWVEKWGPIAQPLLWSHAMYLILVDELTTALTNR